MTTTTITSVDPVTGETVTTVTDADGKSSTKRTPGSTEQVNRVTIEARITDALSDNAEYLSITTPTAAQSAAHLKKLTRQVSGLLRLVSGRLDASD